jgi:hypothetical protein
MPPKKKQSAAGPAPASKTKPTKNVRTKQHAFDVEADVWELEEILAKRSCKGVLQYEVKWKGYGSAKNTWVACSAVF